MKNLFVIALISAFTMQINGMKPDVEKLYVCGANEKWEEVPVDSQLKVGTKFQTIRGWIMSSDKKELIDSKLTTLAQAVCEHVAFTQLITKQIEHIAKTQEPAIQKNQKIKHRLELLKTSLEYLQELGTECAQPPFMWMPEDKEFKETLDIFKNAELSLKEYSWAFTS